MRERFTLPIGALLLVAVVVGCRREREARTEDTAAAAPAAVATPKAETTTTASAGTLARRNEAQDHFDRSREAFLRKDAKATAAELRSAAAFMREQANDAAGQTREHVTASAREFDRLAQDAERSAPSSAKRLDYAFARANRAEAERHNASAVSAWAKKDTARTGEELTMAVDHLERAARDAGQTLDASAKSAVGQARTVASEMMRGFVTVPADVERTTSALRAQIARLGARIERLRA